MHVYEVRPAQRSSRRRSDFRCASIWWPLVYLEAKAAISYAKFRSRSHDAVIRVCDECAEKL
jgi:hypothetical protein